MNTNEVNKCDFMLVPMKLSWKSLNFSNYIRSGIFQFQKSTLTPADLHTFLIDFIALQTV